MLLDYCKVAGCIPCYNGINNIWHAGMTHPTCGCAEYFRKQRPNNIIHKQGCGRPGKNMTSFVTSNDNERIKEYLFWEVSLYIFYII